MKQKTYTEKEIFEIIDKFEKENTKVLQTKDIVDEKIIISDYIKWDDFRKLKKEFMTPQGFRKAIEEAGLVGTKFGKGRKR